MDISTITEKLTDAKNIVVNSVSATTNFVYNASSIELLKVKKDILETSFNKKKEQNKIYHKLLADRKQLENLILRINTERSLYDMKVAEIVFSSENPYNIKHDYEKIGISLGLLNNTLQEIYGRMSVMTDMTDENLEKEKILYEESIKKINEQLKDARTGKNEACAQLNAIRMQQTKQSTQTDINKQENVIDDIIGTDTEPINNPKSFAELSGFLTVVTGAGKVDSSMDNDTDVTSNSISDEFRI